MCSIDRGERLEQGIEVEKMDGIYGAVGTSVFGVCGARMKHWGQ